MCVCVVLIGMSPGRFCISLFGHENHVSCQRERRRRPAYRAPYTGNTPTAVRALACIENGQSEVSPWPVPRVAPSLAMSKDAAAERGSQPAQRDEPAHSHTVSICGGVSPPTCHKRYLTSCDYDVRGFSSHSTLITVSLVLYRYRVSCEVGTVAR